MREKKQTKTFISVTGIIASALILSSCSLFDRPKCDYECPWGDDIIEEDKRCKKVCEDNET